MKRPILLCLLSTLLAAQGTEVEITNEPHHHLTFENKSVRVFNVQVDPNTETLTHWHRHDYIAITLGAAQISNHVRDKPPVTVNFHDGDTRFSPATFAHFVRTTGPEPFRNVTIEILEDATLRNSTAKWDDDRSLDILQGGSQQILFIKDGIRVSEFELQPGTVVPKHHYTGPRLLVAVSDVDLGGGVSQLNAREIPSLTLGHLKSGAAKWLPGSYSHTISNIGTEPAKFITLEFP